jgi:hypothetical protein
MYSSGVGVPQDDVAALQWFRRAAEQGDANAELNLGHEAPRDSRRLHSLRGWSHGQTRQVPPRSARAGGPEEGAPCARAGPREVDGLAKRPQGGAQCGPPRGRRGTRRRPGAPVCRVQTWGPARHPPGRERHGSGTMDTTTPPAAGAAAPCSSRRSCSPRLRCCPAPKRSPRRRMEAIRAATPPRARTPSSAAPPASTTRPWA